MNFYKEENMKEDERHTSQQGFGGNMFACLSYGLLGHGYAIGSVKGGRTHGMVDGGSVFATSRQAGHDNKSLFAMIGN